MAAYCMKNDVELEEVLKCLWSDTSPKDHTLARALEDAKHWEAGLVVLSLFVARVLERYRHDSEYQAVIIGKLHDHESRCWLEIQEMDHHYIRQLLLQDPGAERILDEILMEVAQRIADHDYA